MKIQICHTFHDIISLENLLVAWREFRRGKRGKPDVKAFELHLLDNLGSLHDDLAAKTYRHGGYRDFFISDPKPRHIHKASVRDRVLHHAIYHTLYPFFDRTFIATSFSCRTGKGTHKASNCFRDYARRASRNYRWTCWALKMDIKKFFASIDQIVLAGILAQYIPDRDILWLLEKVVGSFQSTGPGKGLPLGNLTSQLLVNIYMNEFDQFVKHRLKAKHYIRYADDFVLLSPDKTWLEAQVPRIEKFLQDVLCLSLHPDKVYIRSLASGVDFLGWVHFLRHRVLRAATARRMRKRISGHPTPETVQSYLGLLSHGKTYHLRQHVLADYWLWRDKSG